MRVRIGGWWRNGIAAAWLAVSTLVPAAAPAGAVGAAHAYNSWVAAAAPRTEQHQQASEHFLFRYDPVQMDDATLRSAMDAAEDGYARCAKVFPVGGLPRKVTVDLTPSFVGATGYAVPERYAISVRVPELDYLGLRIGYVMAHEVAHVFTYAELSARGAGRGDAVGPWGEGLADYAAGGFGGIALADWWASALRGGGLWDDPQWLVSGASGPPDDDFVRERTSTYAQPALLIRHLVSARGRDAFFRFYAGYTSAAARQARARHREHRPQTPAERAALDDLFREHFGSGGEDVLAQWRRRLQSAPAPAVLGSRLALHQHIYGSIREFETRYGDGARQRALDEETAGKVRGEFRLANHSLQEGDLDLAAAHLSRARALFTPRRPDPGAIAAWTPGAPLRPAGL